MDYLIELSDVKKHFKIKGSLLKRKKRYVKAVDGISLNVKDGENLGLAGESGCGKTTLGRLVSNLIYPSFGSIKLFGKEIKNLSRKENLDLRRNIQVIFQDPDGSLNPRQSIRKILSKPFFIHKIIHKKEVEDRVKKLLNAVGLIPPESFLNRYPHELSGGQRQRVGIARAIALHPKVVIADEPVSALDVSIRAQILELLYELQIEFGLTYLFISHDLSVLRWICQKIAIMYLGKIVEIGNTEDIFTRPFHPYTKALLASTPTPNPHKTQWLEVDSLEGEIPSPIDPPFGCRFYTRCKIGEPNCMIEDPKLIEFGDGHYVACSAMADRLGTSSQIYGGCNLNQ